MHGIVRVAATPTDQHEVITVHVPHSGSADTSVNVLPPHPQAVRHNLAAPGA